MAKATLIPSKRTVPDDVSKEIDSLILARHVGNPFDDRDLDDKFHRWGVTEQDQADRLRDILERKRTAAEQRHKAARPDFTDAGVILVPAEPTDLYVVFTRGEIENVLCVYEILAGDTKLPDLTKVRLHRAPGDSEEWYSYLCKLLVDVHHKVITPKFVATLSSDPKHGRLSLNVDPKFPHYNFGERLDRMTFVRVSPEQTQAMLDDEEKTLRETVKKRGDTASLTTTAPFSRLGLK